MEKKDKLKHYNWRIGDRYDGWRVRKVDALFSVVPFILPTRVDSEVFYEVKVPIDAVETFIREHKKEIPGLSIMHVVMAAMVRLISQRPIVNRFIVWNKIFARNHISFSLVIKRSLSDAGEETVIKIYFSPTDTLVDVAKKLNAEIEKNIQTGSQNTSEALSKLLGYFPDFLLRTAILFVKMLDKIGIMPKFFFRISPFHSTLFLTNLGSIGAESIYHHLYEFGTCSMFASMGKKSKITKTDKDADEGPKKIMVLKFVLDERICDGFYYASSMRMYEKTLSDPSVLLSPPQQVFADEGVGRKRADI